MMALSLRNKVILGAGVLGLGYIFMSPFTSKENTPNELAAVSSSLSPSDYARLTETLDAYRQENVALGSRITHLESQLQLFLDHYATTQQVSSVPQTTREAVVPSSPVDPQTLEDLLAQYGTVLTGRFLDILDAQKKLGVDPRLASAAYAQGMTLADLQRLQDEISRINHMATPLGMSVDAQANLLQTYDGYQQQFMKNNGLTPAQFATLAKDNPALFEQYSFGKWQLLGSWAQGAETLTVDQKNNIAGYLSKNTDHLTQDIAEKKKKANGN